MTEELKKQRDEFASAIDETDCYASSESHFKAGFDSCYELLKEREKVLIKAYKILLDRYCDHDYGDVYEYEARQALEKIKGDT